ncbi:MAG TPA: hypothetical protein ENN94_00440, partial [Geoalkalibacter subterraneus]|nr:hypothetical protein [Geoalkalibacter subterraneus]
MIGFGRGAALTQFDVSITPDIFTPLRRMSLNPEPASRLNELTNKILSYGKENLTDILHVLEKALRLLSQRSRSRVYLEDLTRGILACSQASGPYADLILLKSFPINNTSFAVSRVYINQEELV